MSFVRGQSLLIQIEYNFKIIDLLNPRLVILLQEATILKLSLTYM